MIGNTISHYKILQKLGQGGMGVVYKAQDTKLDRIVVLKFLPKYLLCDEEAEARFVRGAKAASALDHPNIATIYEIDEVEGDCFISRAYFEGKSVKEITREKAIPVRTALEIAIKIGEGLAAAHKIGILHRNVKSNNVVLTKKGGIKITDFGLPTWKPGSGLTETGETLSGIQYLSPEQARGDQIDRRSDIFSFGVVLYEMITGQLPFTGEDETAIINSILNEAAKPMARYQKEAPEQLQGIVEKLLQKDTEFRYHTMDEVLADLTGLKRELISRRPLAFRKIRPRYKGILIPALIICFVIAVILLVLLNKYLLGPILRKRGSAPHPPAIGAMCSGDEKKKNSLEHPSEKLFFGSDKSEEFKSPSQNPRSRSKIGVKASAFYSS